MTMWFKNLQIYRLPEQWPIGLESFAEQLDRGPFVKCQANQPTSRGFISPRDDGSLVCSVGQGQWLIALKTQERLLPSSVINDEVKERADALEEQQGYAPGRKQMRELRERVAEELMPRAFTRSRTTFAWINQRDGFFCIDATSMSKAEELIAHLRLCLDEFPIRPLLTHINPSSAMADWLAGGDAPAGFTIDRDCELRSVSEDRAMVKYARGPLDQDQIKEHLSSGKLPTRLALTCDDRLSFVLTDNLDIKRLAFLDLLKDQGTDGVEDQFESDFALMSGELSRFIQRLIEVLGGEVIDLAEQGK